MTHDDRARFAAVLTALAETFNEPLSTARLEGYWLALADLPLDAVEAAVQRALREAKFFPKPAELRTLAGVGDPDASLVEQLLANHLRGPMGDRTMPADPFLKLVVRALGGLFAVVEMRGADRVFALGRVLPGVVNQARHEGLRVPTLADATSLPAITRRSLELADGGTGAAIEDRRTLTRDEARRAVVDIATAVQRRAGGA